MEWLGYFEQSGLRASIVQTVALFAGIGLIRVITLRAIDRSERLSEPAALQLRVLIRNMLLAAVLVALVWIWAEEIRDLAISLVAVAVALVLSTKELILCMLGSVVRASGDSFTLGDRIMIQGYRGDVIDHRLFTTTLLESGPEYRRTGRVLVLPNSLFLTDPVFNETFRKSFALHIISIPVRRAEKWESAERRLLTIAQEVCAPYLEEAKASVRRLATRHGLKNTPVAPSVTVKVVDADNIELLLRVPTPPREQGRIEQLILRKYLSQTADKAS